MNFSTRSLPALGAVLLALQTLSLGAQAFVTDLQKNSNTAWTMTLPGGYKVAGSLEVSLTSGKSLGKLEKAGDSLTLPAKEDRFTLYFTMKNSTLILPVELADAKKNTYLFVALNQGDVKPSKTPLLFSESNTKKKADEIKNVKLKDQRVYILGDTVN